MEIGGIGGGGGSGSPLTVTDGITPVVNVTTLDFTSGATVTSGGAGQANVAIAGSGSFTVFVPTSGTVNGSNTVFTFAQAPKVVILDNATVMNKQNITPDATVNWTGSTTITLTQAPNFNIYAF